MEARARGERERESVTGGGDDEAADDDEDDVVIVDVRHSLASRDCLLSSRFLARLLSPLAVCVRGQSASQRDTESSPFALSLALSISS